MHKFTKVASGEREKKFMLLTTHFVRMIKRYGTHEVVKSNLPPEHQRMDKFTKVASGERERQKSCYSPHFL